jgi:hypothetical protein
MPDHGISGTMWGMQPRRERMMRPFPGLLGVR